MNDQMEKRLINSIGLDRYHHSLRVLETATSLGKIYNVDLDKIRVASILHDCGKFQNIRNLLKMASKFDIILDNVMEHNLELIHGPLGSRIAEIEYGIKDIEILNAIKYHTTGREDMTMLDKIIYISDYIEPKRSFQGVEEVRKMAFKNIERSILLAMEGTIKFLIENEKLIHLDTIKARNKLRILLDLV